MKNKIVVVLLILILLTLVGVIVFKVWPTTDSETDLGTNIENENETNSDWIMEISPIFSNQPSNSVYLYEDSYVITNSIMYDDEDYINHKGKLVTKVTEDLITRIKDESIKSAGMDGSEEDVMHFPMFIVKLKTGEELTLYTFEGVIMEIVNMMNYAGQIWYAGQ